MIDLHDDKNKIFLASLLPTNNKSHILKVLKTNPYLAGFFLEVSKYLVPSALERHLIFDEILDMDWLKALGNLDDALPDFEDGAQKARMCCEYQFNNYNLWDDCLNWEYALLAEAEASEAASHKFRSLMRLSARIKLQQRAKFGYWLIYFKLGFYRQVRFYEEMDEFRNSFMDAFTTAS